MQPIRQIIEDAPDFIPVPETLRHRRVEVILWPLEPPVDPAFDPPAGATDETLTEYERVKVDKIDIPPRDERHVRR
jgi:hypothetical protein